MELFYNFINMIKQKIFNTNIEPDESPQYVVPQYVEPTIEDLNMKINEMNTIIFNKNKVIDELKDKIDRMTNYGYLIVAD